MPLPMALVLWVSLAGPAAPVRLLALGDSFTAGTGSSPEQSFPVRLVALWSEKGTAAQMLNLGVNGYSTEEVIRLELPDAHAFRPTRVTLAIGANDIVRHHPPAEYRQNVRTILDAVIAQGVPPSRIFVLPQPDWARSPTAAELGDPAAYEAAIRSYNGILKEEAERAKATWVDLSPLMEKEAAQGQLASDGLHPSAAAYAAWAAELLRVIPPRTDLQRYNWTGEPAPSTRKGPRRRLGTSRNH